MTPDQIHALVLAVDQCLDDMGDIGTSVCGLAKAQLRIAFEPFIGGDVEPPKYTLEAAVEVHDEDDNFYWGSIPSDPVDANRGGRRSRAGRGADRGELQMKIKHPGKTPAQRRALDAIGDGNYSPAMTESTKKALLGAGLIEKCGVRTFGAGWSAAHVDMFEMPTPVHIRWREFHAQAEDGEPKVQK